MYALQKLKQSKSKYSRNLIKNYKSHPKNLSPISVAPQKRSNDPLVIITHFENLQWIKSQAEY